MSRLYQLTNEFELLMARGVIDPETGEIASDAETKLDELSMAIEEKALAVAKYADSEDNEAAGIEAQATAMHDRAKELEKRAARHRRHAEWLRQEYLVRCLGQYGLGPKNPNKQGIEVLIQDNEIQIAVTKGASAVPTVADWASATPKALIKKKIVQAPDKTEIRKRLLDGLKVKGWTLEWSQRLITR